MSTELYAKVAAPYPGVNWDEWYVFRPSDKETFGDLKVHKIIGDKCGIVAGFLKSKAEGDNPIFDFEVDGAVLELVLKYLAYHQTDPAKIIDKTLSTDAELNKILSPWDYKYVMEDLGLGTPEGYKEHKVFIGVLRASHKLQVKELRSMGCATAAFMTWNEIKSAPNRKAAAEKIRQLWHIKNDFTKEEEADLDDELWWCEEDGPRPAQASAA